MVAGNNQPGDKQPQACAFADVLGGEERFEDTANVVDRYAGSVIFYRDNGLLPLIERADFDSGFPVRLVMLFIRFKWLQYLSGIDHQIEQNLFQFAGDNFTLHRVSGRFKIEQNAAQVFLALSDGQGIVDQYVQITAQFPAWPDL